MILDGEARKTIKSLGDFAELCRGLGDAELARDVATAFLVCKPSSALHAPDGPQATLRVDLRLMAAVREGRFAESCPAWPLRRRQDSVYSFVSVGRTQNCDVWIPDESVSKLHALIREKGAAFQIVDSGSRNRTLVDGVLAPQRGEGEAAAIQPLSEVRFGNVETVFFPAAAFRKLVLDVVGPELT